MKRALAIIGLLVAVLLVIMANPQPGQTSERPLGQQSQQYYLLDFDVTTGNDGVDTTTTPTGSNSKLFLFDAVKNYANLWCYYLVEYTSLDTAGASTDMDTTVDTVAIDLFTSEYDGAPYKQIYTVKVANIHTTANVANTDYGYITTLSDSLLMDNVYARLRTWIADSTAALADSSLGAQYKVTLKWWAK
jgi:hypothetical protein